MFGFKKEKLLLLCMSISHSVPHVALILPVACQPA